MSAVVIAWLSVVPKPVSSTSVAEFRFKGTVLAVVCLSEVVPGATRLACR